MMKLKKREAAVLILCGGRSSRMGREKALLRFDHQHYFISQIISIYQLAGIQSIFVLVNRYNHDKISKAVTSKGLKVNFILNQSLNDNRFESILTGLKSMSMSGPVFLQSVDGPFISVHLLEKMMAEFDSFYDLLQVSHLGKKGHPILLGNTLVDELIHKAGKDDHLKDYISSYSAKVLEVNDAKIHCNINTTDEYVIHFPNMKDDF